MVITGASSGLGLALAHHYLQRGAIVAAIARRANLLLALAAEFPGQVHCYALDVRDAAALQDAANDFIANAGLPDIVIADAGVSVGTLTEYAEDIDAFQQVMDTNVAGMMKTFHPFVTSMLEAALTCSARSGRQAGTARRAQSMLCEFPDSPPSPSPTKGRGGTFTLVGIASIAGYRGLPGAGAYSASKAAAISYLESLRVELHGSGVKVVTICPGYVKTPMTAANPYPMPFIMDAEKAARLMAGAIERQTPFYAFPWQMNLAGHVLKLLPCWLYDRLFAGAPRKPRRYI